MSALFEIAQAAGIRFKLVGDKVRMTADREPPAELLDKLRAERAQILAELRARDAALIGRCRSACQGLAIWPAELLAALPEVDKAAQLDGLEGVETLRAYAKSLAGRLRTGTLPERLYEAYAQLSKELAMQPGRRFSCEALEEDGDPVLLAVAVRGAGFATLRLPRERYDEAKVLEIVHRWNVPDHVSRNSRSR